MRITILTQIELHPFQPMLSKWIDDQATKHDVSHCTDLERLPGGDVLFIISYHSRVPAEVREAYGCAYVVHASALPKGRGWSPTEWQILEGATEITVSLITAEDEIDSGDIYAQATFEVANHELRLEFEAKLFAAELTLMTRAVDEACPLSPSPQAGESTTYRRRTPEDSRLDPSASIESQFDLLRIADSDRFPAFIEVRGHRYHLHVSKAPK